MLIAPSFRMGSRRIDLVLFSIEPEAKSVSYIFQRDICASNEGDFSDNLVNVGPFLRILSQH